MNRRVKKRLDEVYQASERITLYPRSRYVFMSDCHRGIGNRGDNFTPNQNLFYAALQYYSRRNYSYIEAGDGDELWENRCLRDIIQTHSESFWLMSQLYRQGRFYMLYGNHDRKKEKKEYVIAQCQDCYLESRHCAEELFPGIIVREGLILSDSHGQKQIFIVHGHQGDFINDTVWKLGRFLVRHVWRKLELLGFLDPTSAAKNYRKKNKTEQDLAKWAKEHHTLLLAGHTHRSMLTPPGEGYYLNDGSCVHPLCITAIELEDEQLRLVKWSQQVQNNGQIYVGRDVLSGPFPLEDYFI